jgi:hypothetical protein
MWVDVKLRHTATIRCERSASLAIEVTGVYLLKEGYSQTVVSITCFQPNPSSMKLSVDTTFVGTLNNILEKIEQLIIGDVSLIELSLDYSRILIDSNHSRGHLLSFLLENEFCTTGGERISGLNLRGMSARLAINFMIGSDFGAIIGFRDELHSMALELDYELDCIRALQNIEEGPNAIGSED